MNRREFLKISGLALMQLALWSCRPNIAALSRGKKIIVVGAGMSGLAAATKLKSFGFEVVVLEGRDRLGGRIWTDHSLGFAADMGASWIHGVKGNPITALAKDFNVQHVATPFDSVGIYGADGKRWKDDDADAAERDFFRLIQKAQKEAEDFDEDVSLENALNRIFAREKFSSEQKSRFAWVRSAIELEQASEFSDMSAWYYNDDEEFSGLHHVFPGGYGQLIKGLADGLEIKTGCVVRKIEHADRNVRVHTNDRVFTADAAVVTLPLGVLRSGQVEFSPELPKKKRQAISALNMGLMNKVYMKFPKVFWPENEEFFGHASSRRGEFPEFLNLKKSLGHNALIAFTGGDFSRELEGLSDVETLNAAFAVVKKMFGSGAVAPSAFKISRWCLDPFAGGSYSYIPVGGTSDDYDALAEPVGKTLFFAGEATHRSYPATVHGAFLSGVREADRVAKL